ncbi:MAG: hypothetical protein BEN19_03275 [Epulopiscium sp. Nuni2H_MBin003]|nr:MAG: hypothetical protein BEN19_03275 [Epulopiscium sp. Nuni2H_MBin003]
MICVRLYFKNYNLYRFRVEGHANYSRHGSDIVCAGVSTLVLTTINSIDAFLDETISINEQDEKKGIIDCTFLERENGVYNAQTTILLKSMVLGLESIEQKYGEYISIKKLKPKDFR